MKKFLETIKRCPLFTDIAEPDLLRMLNCMGATIQHFDKKYTVINEGNPAKYVGVVLTGRAQILQIDYYGNRSILGNIEPSEVFAEAYACAELSAVPVAVIANEPSDIMLIEAAHILHTCSNHCDFHQRLIYNLMKDLANKTIMFHQKIEIVGKRTTRDKLMTYLMYQAKKAGSNRFTIPFDRQELADYLEVDRSGLSAEISKLRNEGVLDSNRKQFRLL